MTLRDIEVFIKLKDEFMNKGEFVKLLKIAKRYERGTPDLELKIFEEDYMVYIKTEKFRTVVTDDLVHLLKEKCKFFVEINPAKL